MEKRRIYEKLTDGKFFKESLRQNIKGRNGGG